LVHGVEGQVLEAPWALQNVPATDLFLNVLLYPCDTASPLQDYAPNKGKANPTGQPIRLVVPDGNWRQAQKMTKRLPWMATLPRVGLPGGIETTYRLRSEPKEGGLATMEAIAQAFAVIEGPQVYDALYEVFRRMTDRTLYSRGLLSREEVYGGIPDGIQRHVPGRLPTPS